MPPDILDDELISSRCRGGSECGYEVHLVTESTTTMTVMAHGFWEIHNEIYTDHVPGNVGDGKWAEFSNWRLPLGFCLKAEVAGRDVLSYVPGYLRPPVVPVFSIFLDAQLCRNRDRGP